MDYKKYIIEMADYRAFHGTPVVFGDFSYEHVGKGNDSLGVGFYFADQPEVAGFYAEGDEGANIRPVTLVMDKPIHLDEHDVPKERPLTRLQIKKIILKAPDLDDALSNFGDVSYEGMPKVLNHAVELISGGYDVVEQINMLWRDIYHRDDLKYFASVIKKVTGYDGIIKTWVGGIELDYDINTDAPNSDASSTHYVVWDVDQIKPLGRTMNESYEYAYCCVSPTSAKELDFIIDNMKKVSKEEFFKNVKYEEIVDALGGGSGVSYTSKKQLIDDWGNRYYKINKRGIDAYILVNSAIEHVFKNTEPTIIKKEYKPRSKKIVGSLEYRGYKVGDKLPKSGYEILDMITHDSGNTQFLLKTGAGNKWYAADMIVDYEVGD
jgi:hypothetical protein